VTADRRLLDRTAELAGRYLDSLPERPVAHRTDLEALRSALGGPLPESGEAPLAVVEHLASASEPGLVASGGPRYFGFVIGGSLPAAMAADWLAVAWDQNAAGYVTSPAAAVAEETCAGWLLELFDLPRDSSVGFVTGGQGANTTGLAAARHAVLARAGWDVGERGLQGAPRVRTVVGAEGHVTVFGALRLLGLGMGAEQIDVDGQGRMIPEALERALAGHEGPLIVAAQAGNVNTGCFDPLREIAGIVRGHGGWLHVDGAFGLWARTAPSLRHLADGLELADSWGTDAHKWLNVPYDSGISIVRDPASHVAAMARDAAYLQRATGGERDPAMYTPDASRRARGFALWAALRSLGRSGVVDLVERCCSHARRFAERLGAEPGVDVLNDVVLNQVLVRFDADDERTRAVVAGVQEDGTCWLGGTFWQGRAAMRISVSGWQTTETDVDRSVEAILNVLRNVRSAG
jgi:glutamate/tyrosine decarboxylase-like PLP-dependent enzyme